MTVEINTPQSAVRIVTDCTTQPSFANSEDPNEMQHTAAFHQGLHCL